MSKTTRGRPSPKAAWGTARGLGLAEGAVLTYYGHDPAKPDPKGVKVRVTRPHGGLVLERVTTGEPVLTGGAAVRFWGRQAPAAGSADPGEGDGTGSPFGSPEATRAARVDGHPGVTWLAMMTAADQSQTETARRMGVAAVTLNRLVRGRAIPTARMTIRFARAIGAHERTMWEQVCEYELALALDEHRAARGGKARG